MQQWREAKSRHPDALIFFRVGDFYEMFCEDAEEGARLLGLTLTSRNNGGAANVPLAGVPVRAKDEYLQRLIRLGKRVAVCEQVEDPAEAKGIVRREVTETVTPGAVLADALLAERRNNFLVSLRGDEDRIAIAAADVSTGEVVATSILADELESTLASFEPAELLLPQSWEHEEIEGGGNASRTLRPDYIFDPDMAADELRRRYQLISLDAFGFQDEDRALIGALGALVAYLADVQPAAVNALKPPRILRGAEGMALDEMTRRNLELVEPLRPDLAARGARAATLIEVLDDTLTGMGARLLRQWLLRPLVQADPIWRRQEAVAELFDHPPLRRGLRAVLKQIRDLGRLSAKVANGRILPRELSALGLSLERLPILREALKPVQSPLLKELSELDELPDVRALIARAIADEPAATLAEGGVIRAGYDAELDQLRGIRDGGTDFIAALQARERERSGITSLKVGFNKVFGYYLEITRTNLDKVPSDYERKQTLANAERYVTPELKELEEKVLSAEDKIGDLEALLFADVRRQVAESLPQLQALADHIAVLDVLATLAQVSERNNYVRPIVHTGYDIDIRGGRHPVVETMMPREEFIPNDVRLDHDARVMVLTGPNMAGKSTLLRQVGLIQIMAQIGSFVPASAAHLPVCDRVFTRVGASDNLVRGQSTFLVEMNETAAILHGATDRSLVLLDEIGRGTATYDGVSIAWAVTEHLHEDCRAKTIFATHYHELTQLADQLNALVNFNVSVKEVGNDIVFLHHLQPGGADRSYGIEVARLAGLPDSVVARAREILRELEGAHTGGGIGLGRLGRNRPASAKNDQLSLFHNIEPRILEKLRRIEVETITPIQALNVLFELKAILMDSGKTR